MSYLESSESSESTSSSSSHSLSDDEQIEEEMSNKCLQCVAVDFYEKLKEFRVNEKYTDVVIECEEQSFKCHRVVLAVASTYFDAMFTHNFKESTSESISLRDVTNAPSFEQILQLIYTGDDLVTITPDVGDFFGMDVRGQNIKTDSEPVDFLENIKTNSEPVDFLVQQYSKLNEFRDNEKLTDVVIEFEEEKFKCHRVVLAAFDYFHSLFERMNCKDACASISLNHVTSSATFKEILRFIYTGKALITFDNIHNLLLTSDLMKLRGVEELCLKFLEDNEYEENKCDIGEIMPIFVFACRTNKMALIEILARRMTELFGQFSEADEFCETPFDVFSTLVHFYHSPDEDPLLKGILRWLNHSYEERAQYSDELIRSIQFQNVSAIYKRFFAKSITKPANYTEYSRFQDAVVAENLTSPFIYFNDFSESQLHAFCCDNSRLYNFSRYCTECIRSVGFDNYLYTLNHRDSSHFVLSSCVADSDMGDKPLQSPPTDSDDFRMCSLYNKYIYLYHYNFGSIHEYQCEVDSWIDMKNEVRTSGAITASEDTLYLIGGQKERSSIGVCAQAYDHRSGKWRELPQPRYEYLGAACCAFEGKIYVCGGAGGDSSVECEVYSPKAGKWDVLEPLRKGDICYQSGFLVPYVNKLWFFGADRNHHRLNSDFRVHLYNFDSNKWSTNMSINRAFENFDRSELLDVVVFKSR